MRSKSVSVSPYWMDRLEAWIKSQIRKSKAEIVEEGLKRIALDLEAEKDLLEDAKRRIKEEKESDV